MVMGLARALQGVPNFEQAPQVNVANTDVIGPTMAAYQAQLAQWQADQARNNALTGSLFGLGGSLLGAGLMPGGFLGGLFGSSAGTYGGAPIMSLGANLAKFGR